MKTTILLDHHLEDRTKYFQAGLRETGWDDLLTLDFMLLRDFGLPDNLSDQGIWRFVQQHRLWLITSNRNRKGETSLQATIERENTPDSLPVITIAQAGRLVIPDYRQQAIERLAEIILYPEKCLGMGRAYIP
jgi:hypothetical protein